MNITIHVPSMLRNTCGGAAEVDLAASNVRAALEQLERQHPPLHRAICDETGRMRRHVNLFVNSVLVRELEGFDTALKPGDVLTILPAVSGG